MNPQIPAPRGSVRRALAGSSFGTRLFLALTVVVVGCAASAWLVASALAPGIFHDHLGQAGIDHNSSQAAHVEEAFAWAIVLAWGLAVGIAVLLALAVSWYITRRVQRSLTAVTTSTARIAGGRYDTRVTSPGLGREFDDLALTVNELARRLEPAGGDRTGPLHQHRHEDLGLVPAEPGEVLQPAQQVGAVAGPLPDLLGPAVVVLDERGAHRLGALGHALREPVQGGRAPEDRDHVVG